MEERLESFLQRIGDNFSKDWYNIRDVQQWMLEEIFRKFRTFPRWRKKLLFSWSVYKKRFLEKNPSIDRESSELEQKLLLKFFSFKFNELFLYFFDKMYPFDVNRIEMLENKKFINNKKGKKFILKEDDSELFFEYAYYLHHDEVKTVEEYKNKFNHPESYEKILPYLFNLIIITFKKLINDILDNHLQIRMLAGRLKNGISIPEQIMEKSNIQFTEVENNEVVIFLINLRFLDLDFIKIYLNSEIFHFAEKIPQTPEKLLEKLRRDKDKLYHLAYEKYSEGYKNIEDVLFTLTYKASILEQITPILDIMNFICSRIEDSIFDTKQLLTSYIEKNYTKDDKLKNAYIELFEFLNKNASLFSTFQANNSANETEQYHLFFFYTQYFCTTGIDTLNNKSMFFPDEFESILKQYPQFIIAYENGFKDIFNQFVYQGLILIDRVGIEHIFYTLFNTTISKLNEMFFESFLYSFNKKYKNVIDSINTKYGKSVFTFDNCLEFVSGVLKYFVQEVFIAKTPEIATKNFHDNISRYTPERLSLRLLELKIFKEIPLSDNNWQDYFLSRNKNYVRNIFKPNFEIPKKYFFSKERLLKINMLYEQSLTNTTPYLEHWIVKDIFVPFWHFVREIEKKLFEGYSKQDLSKAIFNKITENEIDQVIRDKIEDLCLFIASFF